MHPQVLNNNDLRALLTDAYSCNVLHCTVRMYIYAFASCQTSRVSLRTRHGIGPLRHRLCLHKWMLERLTVQPTSRDTQKLRATNLAEKRNKRPFQPDGLASPERTHVRLVTSFPGCSACTNFTIPSSSSILRGSRVQTKLAESGDDHRVGGSSVEWASEPISFVCPGS